MAALDGPQARCPGCGSSNWPTRTILHTDGTPQVFQRHCEYSCEKCRKVYEIWDKVFF